MKSFLHFIRFFLCSIGYVRMLMYAPLVSAQTLEASSLPHDSTYPPLRDFAEVCLQESNLSPEGQQQFITQLRQRARFEHEILREYLGYTLDTDMGVRILIRHSLEHARTTYRLILLKRGRSIAQSIVHTCHQCGLHELSDEIIAVLRQLLKSHAQQLQSKIARKYTQQQLSSLTPLKHSSVALMATGSSLLGIGTLLAATSVLQNNDSDAKSIQRGTGYAMGIIGLPLLSSGITAYIIAKIRTKRIRAAAQKKGSSILH